jgi:hypothetical protein
MHLLFISVVHSCWSAVEIAAGIWRFNSACSNNDQVAIATPVGPSDDQHGATVVLSHTDPNLLPTLEAYDGSADFLRTLELDDDALTKAIIGTMGDLDAYQLPDAKGYAAFSRLGLFPALSSSFCASTSQLIQLNTS